MRKAIAILCLSVFFTLQYSKLVNYWHCKISAVIATVHCDCEKLLVDTHNSGIDHSVPANINEKAEEVYLLHEFAYDCRPVISIIHNSFPSYSSGLHATCKAAIFQPPRA